MAKKLELLLVKSVESLGIVGDTVRVRPGFARNYLLPMHLAEKPTPSKIEALKAERATALAEIAEQRKEREALLERLSGVSIAIKRSCNDQGVLYGSVTQRDIADALQEAGYGVDVRSVRLSQSIGRVGTYEVGVQFEKDLRAEIGVVIEPDRSLEDEKPEMEIDEEGNLVEPGKGRSRRAEPEETGEEDRKASGKRRGKAEEAHAADDSEPAPKKDKKERKAKADAAKW